MSGGAVGLDERVRQYPFEVAEAGVHRCDGGAHSYLADGRVVCWQPPRNSDVRVAIDAEIAGQPVPQALARRWGSDHPSDVWPRWCATEVVAKLSNVPVVELIRQQSVGAGPRATRDRVIHWIVRQVGDLVVAQGLSTGRE